MSIYYPVISMKTIAIQSLILLLPKARVYIDQKKKARVYKHFNHSVTIIRLLIIYL